MDKPLSYWIQTIETRVALSFIVGAKRESELSLGGRWYEQVSKQLFRKRECVGAEKWSTSASETKSREIDPSLSQLTLSSSSIFLMLTVGLPSASAIVCLAGGLSR